MSAPSAIELRQHLLFEKQVLLASRLPDALAEDALEHFQELWGLRPATFHEITQPFTGKRIPLPRWQQAYGHDYRYTGAVNRALLMSELLKPYLEWTQQIDRRLNGLLLNWYDADLRHYIGPHSDSTSGLVSGTPIITISLGATRSFRLRARNAKEFKEFEACHGCVFIMPWETNIRIKHEVPHRKGSWGRRISITARAFET